MSTEILPIKILDKLKKECEEKGYTPDGIPLPETLEKFNLMDKQARELLGKFGLIERGKPLSS